MGSVFRPYICGTIAGLANRNRGHDLNINLYITSLFFRFPPPLSLLLHNQSIVAFIHSSFIPLFDLLVCLPFPLSVHAQIHSSSNSPVQQFIPPHLKSIHPSSPHKTDPTPLSLPFFLVFVINYCHLSGYFAERT